MIVNRCKCNVNNGASRPRAKVADVAPGEARVTRGRRTMKTAANLRATISGRVDLHGRFFAAPALLSRSFLLRRYNGLVRSLARRAKATPTQRSFSH